jgi:hypothetical protein
LQGGAHFFRRFAEQASEARLMLRAAFGRWRGLALRRRNFSACHSEQADSQGQGPQVPFHSSVLLKLYQT